MNKEIKKRRFSLPRLSEDTRELILEIAVLLIALALTPVKFFFSTYPFGIAFCCACKRRTPFAVAGCAIGALLFIDDFVPYLVALLSLVAIRLVGSVWLSNDKEKEIKLGEGVRAGFLSSLFSERVGVRVGICALCTLGLSVYRVIIGGFAYYDIFVLIFNVVFSSILAYALSNASENAEPSGRALGVCALLFMGIFAIRGRELFGLDISIILSYAVSLYASRHAGTTRGVALATVLGVCHGASFAPVFAIGALISCVLWRFSYYVAIIGALVISVGYGILTTGYEAIVYLLPELLLASVVMYPICRFELLPVPSFLSRGAGTYADALGSTRSSELRSGLGRASVAFNDISKMLCDLSEQAKAPSRDFFKGTCLEICESYCYSCPKRSICWERDVITTKDNLAKLSEGAFSQDKVSCDIVNEKFLHRCPNIEKIIDDINATKRELSTSLKRSDKLEVSSQDYEIVARLIDDLSAKIEKGTLPNEALSARARSVCERVGLRCESVSVIGEDRVKVIASGVDIEGSRCSLDEIREELEDALGVSLAEPTISESEGTGTLTLCSARSVELSYFKSTHTQGEQGENGDTLCAFFSPEDKFYMLLCDGMGTGRDAFLTSSMCAEFLQKILSACQNKELCLTMLNNMIRAKSLECSSSVDLLEIDLLNGEACLTKSGAGPSFIKRGASVFRLHSKTAPIGIMRTLDAERLDFSLREGDIVIMISDGIASDERDSKYLVDFLSKVEILDNEDAPYSPEADTEVIYPAGARSPLVGTREKSDTPRAIPISALADEIIALSRSRASASGDDMTVGVAQIKAI